MRKRRVKHQLRLSGSVWNSIKRVRLHLESHVLATEGVAAHVSPDETLRLLLAEPGLYEEPLTPMDERYLPNVIRFVRRSPPPDKASPQNKAVEAP